VAARETWTNWVGNQRFAPREIAQPADEAETVALVREAIRAGRRVRVAAAGHSFTPIVETDGLLLDLSRVAGLLDADRERLRATVLPGTTIGALGEPLWQAGLALANQGDIDTQHIAGAVATGTHGSGVRLTSFSGSVRGVRLLTGHGELVDVDESQPDLLHAAQVAVGMLGVMTRLELAVVPAYRLRERVLQLPYQEVIERFDELVERHRHFSFFWLPSTDSAALYGLAVPPGVDVSDTCFVRLYDEAGPDESDDDTPERRIGAAWRIYPMVYEPNFHELEEFVPLPRGRDAVEATRELMLRSLPDSIFPLEVRMTAGDDGYLSPCYRTATVVVSVSGMPGTDYDAYLRSVDALLAEHGARPHWGKLHFLTRERVDELYPRAEAFRRIRRELDPQGVYLNAHLAPLFA
jgi:FAD/FMN-containing dehydrogenase